LDATEVIDWHDVRSLSSAAATGRFGILDLRKIGDSSGGDAEFWKQVAVQEEPYRYENEDGKEVH
jgi:hypothetical protein